jgi:hypothetical protein
MGRNRSAKEREAESNEEAAKPKLQQLKLEVDN